MLHLPLALALTLLGLLLMLPHLVIRILAPSVSQSWQILLLDHAFYILTLHAHIHSLSLVLVFMMKAKEFKTKIYSRAHSLILSLSHTLSSALCIILVVMIRSVEFKASRFVLMLFL